MYGKSPRVKGRIAQWQKTGEGQVVESRQPVVGVNEGGAVSSLERIEGVYA